jgi:membrane-bound metal-dependent hydrolase YbcI (DUF457 family)
MVERRVPGMGAVVLGLPVAALVAVLPDIDTPRSRAARLLGPVTGAAGWLIGRVGGGHRGVTHSVVGAVLFAVGMYALVVRGWLPGWLAVAACLGWVSHPALDYSMSALGVHTGRRDGAWFSGELFVVRPLLLAGCCWLLVAVWLRTPA